jgi:ankyrin repeat protein
MLGRADEVRAAVDADPTQANAAGAHGIPILFHACIGGQEEIARYLVASGAATNPASLGQCLHAAIHARNVSIARWLIELGADTTTADWQGKTPRERAEETGDAAFVALLSAG